MLLEWDQFLLAPSEVDSQCFWRVLRFFLITGGNSETLLTTQFTLLAVFQHLLISSTWEIHSRNSFSLTSIGSLLFFFFPPSSNLHSLCQFFPPHRVPRPAPQWFSRGVDVLHGSHLEQTISDFPVSSLTCSADPHKPASSLSNPSTNSPFLFPSTVKCSSCASVGERGSFLCLRGITTMSSIAQESKIHD